MNEPIFHLFVYGTLKRGYWNHELFCQDAIFIQPASIIGRLYELPSGIPVLDVPKESILSVGSNDVCHDAQIQNVIGPGKTTYPECSDPWRWIEGEMIALPDPYRTVPPIDQLEGFSPGGAFGYRRVLVRASLAGQTAIPAWCYVSTQSLLHDAQLLCKNAWP